MFKIAERLRPFSHEPGMCALIPGTEYLVEGFPARLCIRTLSGALVKEERLNVQGPVKGFTLMQDLERGFVTLFSESYCFHILPSLEIVTKKHAPQASSSIASERLSLGSHKKQEWEQIRRRCDFKEIFPFWFHLGTLFTLPPRSGSSEGVFSLIEEIKLKIQTRQLDNIIPTFEKLFRVGFSKMLVPRCFDEEYQGILPLDTPISTHSPFYLLTEGSALIRSLFVEQQEHSFRILPHLPPEFPVGRFLHLKCLPYGTLSLEWSKKEIRQVYFCALQSGTLTLSFPHEMRSYRVREKGEERGKRVSCDEPLEIKSHTHYLLDRFQK